MTQFYIKYSPARIGLTGSEYLPQFLDQHYPGVTFNGVISDSFIHYGILTGTGDIFSNSITTILGKFSVIRLTETEFIGNCFKIYDPTPIGDDTPPTFVEFMARYGITTTDVEALEAYKLSRINLFKEISKKKCEDDNDSIADLAKCVTLLNGHYPTLTAPEKAAVDADMGTLMAIYSKTTCIGAFNKMIHDVLLGRLQTYYTAKVSVDSATTIAEIDAVTYE